MVCILSAGANSSFLGTWKLYESGRKRWEAATLYNAIVLMKIIGRPTWWTILLLSLLLISLCFL
jgi:signal peptidase I